MAKSGVNKFMDFLKLSEPEDDFEDDLFDDDEEEEDYYEPPKKKIKDKPGRAYYDDYEDEDYVPKKPKARPAKPASPSKLVSINSRNNNRSSNQVIVIKPQEFNEAQRVTDYLKEGRTIIINMEGIEVHAAQRIIDFIGGACYALDGSLQAISANIFIAAPDNIEVSGDLRDEILNETTLSPELLSAF
ncbi:MAG: cell division protein SepF [Lachnospiraceae bacterium]|nr:cell division protein SepF [Lachnospiraceae bacterium]MDE6626119.1 cell division protein SepF [Lachnospiraceae bacterium]